MHDPQHPLTTSEQLHAAALDVFPGGVSHNIRYFEPHPIYIARASDSRIWDVDGNEYVDFWMNHMASVLGHAYPDVVEAVTEQARDGLHYGAPNEVALELGRLVRTFVPSAERVRFCASGTEATMYAVRLARAHTDRDRILKAEGGWHGGNTDLSVAIHAPYDQPETAGLPPGVTEQVHAFPVNDPDAVVDLLERYRGEVAAIIVEPMLLAGGGVTATDEFLRTLREECDARGCVLIFDEVVTGFRVSPGSYQARIGVLPDLTTLGKFLGGGLPVGALAGRAELFEPARPDIDVPPVERVIAGGGTFSMNPMTAAAGVASLRVLDDEPVFAYTESRAERVRTELAALFEELNVDSVVLGESSLFLPHFAPEGPLDSVGAVETKTDRDALRAYHVRLLEHGYYFLPGHMGSVSYQTTDAQLDGFLDATRTVVGQLRGAGRV
ncbi:aspartate aminotransferase family protein [Halomarina halobia]|uniref:Glutamate-1-semialdehyde 2,1-aminomutase n=1 Tax=Halomarina halobia TaxID=3033386 RepID=A0ABD6AG67_9EURY|nr:aspartate aminotransferase family protein [Halomarina sp. PSR21]